MQTNWKRLLIKDIAESMADAPFGSDLKSSDYTDQGVLVIQGKNIQGRNCDWSDKRYVSIEKYDKLTRSHCLPGDLIFPKVGTIGKVGILTALENQNEYILSTNTMRLRTNENIAHSLYVFYYFSLPEIQNLIQALNSKSVQPVFNYTSLKNFPVPLPPLPEQRAIAHILGSLDDKIELNRRMNATLEATARALFQSWFVDFDPVHAKARGEQPSGMDAATGALFPDHFEDSPLGPIPAGWHTSRLSELCSQITSGGTPSTRSQDYWNGVIPWLSSGETRNRFIIGTEKTITQLGVDQSSTRLIPQGATVIASAGQGHTRGQTSLLMIDTYINQSVVALIADTNAISNLYLFFDLSRRYEELRSLSDSHSSRGSLTTKLLSDLRVIKPSLESILVFDNLTKPMVDQIHHNLIQSTLLEKARDALLPKLVNGEVMIGEI